MSIGILHISDIHIKRTHDNPILRRVEAIAAAICGCDAITDQRTSDLIVAITGDVAYSGVAEEYELAANFLKNLKSAILDRRPTLALHVVAVPGNHDCDFSSKNSVRDLIVDQFNPNNADVDICEAATKVQIAYREFAKAACTPPPTESSNPFAFQRVSLALSSGQKVVLQLLNTAITSRLKERPGQLHFPIAALPSPPDLDDATLVVSLFHHPYNWLEPNNARTLRTFLESTSDVILSGHEHDPGAYRKEKLERKTELNHYFEGGALQEHGESHISAFNLIVLDIEAQSQAIHEFQWHKDLYRGTTTPYTTAFHRNSARLRNRFSLSPDFEAQLLDPGANYSHPKKTKLSLLDLYVYPFLREFEAIPSGDGTVGRIVTRPLEYVLEQKKLLIRGAETAGKTAFSKMLTLDLRQAGIVPLLVAGSKFISDDPGDCTKLEAAELARQYAKVEHDAYRQLSQDKRAIIIDDFHSIPLKPHRRNALIELLGKRFGVVVLFSADELGLDELLNQTESPSELWAFKASNILEFGHVQRSDLVERWLKLDRDLDVEPTALYARQIHTENLLTQLVGRNLVPAYPAYLLVVLQQLEAQIPLETEAGSVGYFYEVLITQSLNRVAGSRTDIDTQYSYLSELAYLLFSGSTPDIDLDGARPWHNSVCERYHLRINLERNLQSLSTAGVLIQRNGRIAFRYPYIYYYFVGRYLHTHLNDAEVQSKIQEMCTRLHHETTANVMVFLCYLSKDAFVLDSLLQASRTLYQEERDCNLCLSDETVRSLLVGLPSFRLNDKAPHENRRDHLARRDELSFTAPPPDSRSSSQPTDQDYATTVAPFFQLNAAFKTIQILGQILREFAGSIEGERKIELLNECYSLGLRVLNWILRVFEEAKDELVSAFGAFLTSADPRLSQHPDKLERKLRAMIFGLLERISFIVVKHIASSVGLKKLSITFERLLAANPDVPRRLIDLAIRLDHFDSFPEKEALALRKDLEDNLLARTVLQHLVWQHFLMFPENYQLRQRVCEKLGIKVHSPQLLDSRTKKTPPKTG